MLFQKPSTKEQQQATITMSTEMSIELASKLLFDMYNENPEEVMKEVEEFKQEKHKKKLIIKSNKKLTIYPKKKLSLDKHKKKNSEVMLELLRERKGCKKVSVKIRLNGGVVIRYNYISSSIVALPDW